jgi:hypothetical protein
MENISFGVWYPITQLEFRIYRLIFLIEKSYTGHPKRTKIQMFLSAVKLLH